MCLECDIMEHQMGDFENKVKQLACLQVILYLCPRVNRSWGKRWMCLKMVNEEQARYLKGTRDINNF